MVQLEVARRMAAERGTKDYACLRRARAAAREGEHRAQGPADSLRSAAKGTLGGRGDGAQRTSRTTTRGSNASCSARSEAAANGSSTTCRSRPAGRLHGSSSPSGTGLNARAEELAPEDFVALYAGAILGAVMREVQAQGVRQGQLRPRRSRASRGRIPRDRHRHAEHLARRRGGDCTHAAGGFDLSCRARGGERSDRRNATLSTWPGRRCGG